MKRRTYGRWRPTEDEVIDEEIEETEKIPEKTMKHEIVEGERETNTTITVTAMAISPNDEFSNISEENPVCSKTTQKNNLLMAAQLGMKGPPPVGEQPVDKMFNSQLIKEISQHPALFDFTCDEYKSIEARNRHWEEVSSRSCQPLEFVRTRWKTLRDRFKKEVRRVKQQQIQQPENAFIGCWHHFEEMLFLLPFVRDKAEEVVSYSKDGEGERSSPDVTTSAQALIQAYTLAKQRQLNNNNSSINILNSENQQQSQMQSCTAAILDLAMNAVHKCNKENGENNNERECLIEENDDNNEDGGYSNKLNGNNNLNISTKSSINRHQINSSLSSSIRYPKISEKHQQYQNNQKLLQLRNFEINNRINNNWRFPQTSSEIVGENEDDEDHLFCRIVLKKLGKLDERVKDTAKIKIMELLLNLQYGECNNNNNTTI
ncbi:hypothetical protein ACQ4LE_005544 [Meloidogyne hapla]|uniref:MADF domain-containing protein n=1 Tax=Meloidogyne hapla TaxID=6305 RepID=A0A1I8B3K0_MELHA